MHIRLELPRARLRRWHGWLVEHLSTDSANQLSVVFTDGEELTPTALGLLLSLEALTQSHAAQSGTATITPDQILKALARPPDTACDVIVHIGRGCKSRNENARKKSAKLETARHVTLLFDDDPSEDALWSALLDRRVPKISLSRQSDESQPDHTPPLTAYPGLEAPHMISHSADAVFSRAIELIAMCVSDQASDDTARSTRTAATPLSQTTASASLPSQNRRFVRDTGRALTRRVGDKARAVLQRVTKTAPNWSVAWRPRSNLAPAATTTLNVQDFYGLPDDGARYYADPFCLDKDGVSHVFVEEFPYATERGLISAFTIDADGHCSDPRPVLETPHHLSYPQIIEHAGEVFMLPEASASGGLDLYRAETFPNVWTHDTRLIDEPLHDATLHFDGTRWWMFAATQFLKSASWCALKVFTADALRGPWQPMSSAPLKVDVRSARPAGGLVVHNDTLWRPAQNCATGYGHALTWCRVAHLTPDTFVEHAVGSMHFANAPTCLGPHTWTATQTIETIDLFSPPKARPRAAQTRPLRP